MNFDLHIQNIGKLTDAKIRIGRFTVFAGANNTGKSFVSKILYSILDAMRMNDVWEHIGHLINSLHESINRLAGHSKEVDDLLSPLLEKVSFRSPILTIYFLAVIFNRNTFSNKVTTELIKNMKIVRKMFRDVRPSIDSLAKENPALFPFSFSEHADGIETIFRKLEVEFIDAHAGTVITSETVFRIKDNLIENFQVENLSDLMTEKDSVSTVSSNHIGELEFSDEKINLKGNQRQFYRLHKFANVIYLESPIYWKLKNVLDSNVVHSAIHQKPESSRKPLSGIPRYFYDLADALKFKYTGDIAFPEIYERLTGKEVLGGKVVISESNDLSFQENGRSFSLPVTAMGVANLGILALLIERKVLDENSLIFIDEPESNLHPAWQVVMAETLFELAKGGAHVVIATHSADILKWLEVHIKKHPEDESFVALNKFPANGREVDDRDFEYRIAAIKQELTRPFADLYAAGL